MTTPPNPFSLREPDFQHLYIFGAGGSGRETAWLAWQLWGEQVQPHFIVDQSQYLVDSVNDIPVSLMTDLLRSDTSRFVVALGSPEQRKHIVKAFIEAGFRPAQLIHPRTEISSSVTIGEGVVICANSVLTCNVMIGAYVQINLSCTVSHDVTVGDYTTLSPGVNISGNVHIGSGVFVGTNACFINGKPDKPLVIGDGAVIAAGACVTQPVPPGAMVAGVPAIKKH